MANLAQQLAGSHALTRSPRPARHSLRAALRDYLFTAIAIAAVAEAAYGLSKLGILQ